MKEPCLQDQAGWCFLYIGQRSIGWLDHRNQLVNPIDAVAAKVADAVEENENTAKLSSAPCSASEVLSRAAKREYLQQYLQQHAIQHPQKIQPQHVAIVLDRGSETIKLSTPQQTMATQPFYLPDFSTRNVPPGFSGLHTVSRDNLVGVAKIQRLTREDESACELSVTSRLQRSADRFRQWPGQRDRTPVVSRQTLYSRQQQTLEWHSLLSDLIGKPVDIFSYPLVTEHLLYSIVGELEAAMVVATQPDGAIRHLFFRQGWLHFARQLPQPLQLPHSTDESEKYLQSSATYIRQHLDYSKSYPVFDCITNQVTGVLSLQCRLDRFDEEMDSQCTVETVSQVLRQALLQRQREFFFAIRHQPVDRLKRWQLESSSMRLHNQQATRTRRVHALKAAGTAMMLVAGISQLPATLLLWQHKQRHSHTLQSVNSSFLLLQETQAAVGAATQPGTREPRVANVPIPVQETPDHKLPAALLKQLVTLPVAMYRQSYAEPAAVLLHLQKAANNYPQLVINKVEWQWLQSGASLVQTLASQLTVSSDYVLGSPSTGVAGFGNNNTLQVSVEGYIGVTQLSVDSMNTIGQELAGFESFLMHLKGTLALRSLQQVEYPFGTSPGARLHAVKSAHHGMGWQSPDSKPVATTRTVKEALDFRRFAFEFTLDGAQVTNLLNILNVSPNAASWASEEDAHGPA